VGPPGLSVEATGAVGLVASVGGTGAVGLVASVGVTVEVGPVVSVGVTVAVGLTVLVDGGAELQAGLVIVLSSRLTWPVRARTRPWIVARFCTVMLARAITVPTKLVVVPMVAELPTCQKTLHA